MTHQCGELNILSKPEWRHGQASWEELKILLGIPSLHSFLPSFHKVPDLGFKRENEKTVLSDIFARSPERRLGDHEHKLLLQKF